MRVRGGGGGGGGVALVESCLAGDAIVSEVDGALGLGALAMGVAKRHELGLGSKERGCEGARRRREGGRDGREREREKG